VGEIVVQRDENNRIVGVSVHGLSPERDGDVANSVHRFLRAVVASMNDYLHVPAGILPAEALRLEVDRTDVHLSREIDAILETLVIGLNMLAEEYPSELVVRESSIGVQV
jgi:uncharacterized protein YsxB (DUF464 family)